MILDTLREPIVQAPMAGGPSTPALAAAVARAGGLGILAAGYKSVDAVAQDIATLRERSSAPFGVNLFVASAQPADPGRIEVYLRELAPEAERYGVQLGAPRHDDDGWEASSTCSRTSGWRSCPSRSAVHRPQCSSVSERRGLRPG